MVGNERPHTLPVTLSALLAMFLQAFFNVPRCGTEIFFGAPAPLGDVWPNRPLDPLQAPDLWRTVGHHIHNGDAGRGHGDLALGRVLALQDFRIAPQADTTARVQQGFIETSNVNVVEELVQMIVTQRAYELNSKAITTSDQMLGKLAQL